MSLSVCFPPKNVSLLFAARSLSGTFSLIQPVRRSCHKRNPQSTITSKRSVSIVLALLHSLTPILAVSLSWEREGRQHIKDTLRKPTCLGFTKQSSNLTKSRFLGCITVVCYPPLKIWKMLFCTFYRYIESLTLYSATCGFRDRKYQLQVWWL